MDTVENRPTSPGSEGPLLRVGLLVDSLNQPAWVERALQRVSETGSARVALVVRNAAPNVGPPRRSRVAAWWANRHRVVFDLYDRWDRRRFTQPNDPFKSVDLSAMLAGVPVLDVEPIQTRLSDRFSEADITRIREANLDVLVRFGFRIIRGGILDAARHGVWSYHHGDSTRYRGGPPGFWEVMEGSPVTGIVLQRLTEELDAGDVLYRSFAATNMYSVTRNRFETYWKGSDFLARALTRLRDEESGNAGEPSSRQPAAYGHRLYVAPMNWEMTRGLGRIAGRRIKAAVRSRLTYDQWFLAYRMRGQQDLGDDVPDLTMHRFRPVYPPRDRYWADPFPVREGSGSFVLFEDYPFSTRRGFISVLEIGADGPIGSPVPVLKRDYHLSYPFVFSWKGDRFMMPESVDAGRVEVYRATRFPFEWSLEATVMPDTMLADCTVAEIGGRWWMFATGAVPGASFWDELHVFHGPTPLGPWTPHRRNPVVSDVRSARPAGKLFTMGGKWYRPSQNCAPAYGTAVNIQQIVRLDTESYEERQVGQLRPEWQRGLTGLHTVNSDSGLTVIDARRPRLRVAG